MQTKGNNRKQRKTKETKGERENKAVQREAKGKGKRNEKRKAKVDQRKDGFSGGVKKALGGDVIGMKPPKGEKENALQKQERQKMNKKARGDFASKKIQQTGNLALDVGKRALDRGPAGDPTAGGGSKPETTSKAKNWGTK